MFQKIINFVKYHNAFTIGLAFVLFATAGAFANDDVREAVIGKEIVIEKGIDNSALLAADLENFDLAMEITAVSQDETTYYIDYSFKTLGIEDNRWQEIAREKILTVSKNALGSEDLGIYATEEISEVADNELAYLKEVQAAQQAKGEIKVVQTTNYSGLIGLVLDVKNKILPGYEPVIKPPEIVVQPEPTPINQPEPTNPITPAPSLEGGDYGDFAGAPENGSPSVGSPYYLWLVKNCVNNGKYWYNNTCNAEPETAAPDDSDSDQETPTSTPIPTSELSAISEPEPTPAPDL